MRTLLVFALAVPALAAGPAGGPGEKADSPLKWVHTRVTWKAIEVRAGAPIPEEVSDGTQARALSREAAIVIAQTHLLNEVLDMKTRKGKTLREAEIPSLDLQKEIRATVTQARVASTQWKDDVCWVKIVLPKNKIKPFLRKH